VLNTKVYQFSRTEFACEQATFGLTYVSNPPIMFPQFAQFTDGALLLLRLMVAVVFVSSGWSHVTKSAERSKSIGLSQGLTIFIGVAELAGGLGVAFGVLTQLAAIGLTLIMLGAISKKIFEWHTGFWGEKGSGWHYDLIFIIMNLVILTTNGGSWTLVRW
jgi:putative oxidoreductase